MPHIQTSGLPGVTAVLQEMSSWLEKCFMNTLVPSWGCGRGLKCLTFTWLIAISPVFMAGLEIALCDIKVATIISLTFTSPMGAGCICTHHIAKSLDIVLA